MGVKSGHLRSMRLYEVEHLGVHEAKTEDPMHLIYLYTCGHMCCENQFGRDTPCKQWRLRASRKTCVGCVHV